MLAQARPAFFDPLSKLLDSDIHHLTVDYYPFINVSQDSCGCYFNGHTFDKWVLEGHHLDNVNLKRSEVTRFDVAPPYIHVFQAYTKNLRW